MALFDTIMLLRCGQMLGCPWHDIGFENITATIYVFQIMPTILQVFFFFHGNTIYLLDVTCYYKLANKRRWMPVQVDTICLLR